MNTRHFVIFLINFYKLRHKLCFVLLLLYLQIFILVILENVFWRDQKGWADFSRHDKIHAVIREELLK